MSAAASTRWRELLSRRLPWRRRDAVVLLYHRIADHRRDPYRLNVRPATFRDQLEVVAEQAQVVSLRQIVRGDHPPGAVAITFDDGYADNVEVAAPILARFGFPATLFVVSGAVGRDEELWWDRLERCLLEPEQLPEALELTLGGETHRWQLPPHAFAPDDEAWRSWCVYFGDNPSPRHGLLRELVTRLGACPREEREFALAALAAWASVPRGSRSTHRAATLAELRALDSSVELGAHTRSHARLAGLDAERQVEEVQGSRRELEKALGRTVDLFAYPHGGRGDYDATSIEVARAAGFVAACSNFPGRVSAATDRFQLPRHLVYDYDRASFARQLAGWLRGADA